MFKYESIGWAQITPEQTIAVGDLTTLHLSVFRTGNYFDAAISPIRISV